MASNKNAIPAVVEEDPEEKATETAEKPTPANDKTPKNDPKPAKEECGFCVYLGPSIRADIQTATIINTSKGKAVKDNKELIAKYPLVEALIIPGDEIVIARSKVATPGNILYEQYQRLAGQLNQN